MLRWEVKTPIFKFSLAFLFFLSYTENRKYEIEGEENENLID